MSDIQTEQTEAITTPEAEASPEQTTWEASQFSEGFTGKPADPVEIDEPKITMANLTEEQLQSMLAKLDGIDSLRNELHSTRDRLNGKFGEFNQALKESKKSSAVKFSADQFKKIGIEYPDLAGLLAEDLSGLWPAQSEAESKPTESSDNIRQEYESKLAQVKVETQQSIAKLTMDFKRPTWAEDVVSADFIKFKEQLTPDARAEFDSSWDPAYVAGTLAKFDEWKAKTLVKNTPNTERLKSNIQPRGTTPDHSPSDADAFRQGFQSIRGK